MNAKAPMRRVSDLNVASNIPLPAPALMLHEIARTEAQAAVVAEARRQIQRIVARRDERFLVIVGPCSIHDIEAGREYAGRLRGLIDRVSEKLQDIVEGREGQYRVRLMENFKGGDCAYPGLELLPDGTFVATTYGHWTEGEEPYVVSVRFRMEEMDERLGAGG